MRRLRKEEVVEEQTIHPSSPFGPVAAPQLFIIKRGCTNKRYLSTMRFTLVVVSALGLAQGFAPVSRTVTSSTSRLHSAVAPPPPQKEAPGAGWEPEWENRPGLTPEEYMESDMTKPDLSGMWECPLTRWDADG